MTLKDEIDEEAGRLFIGGLSWDTTQENFEKYFGQFGELADCVIMLNEAGRSRGFGFVTYKNPVDVPKVLKAGPHQLDGRCIDPKVCLSKASQIKKKNSNHLKVFLGGLPAACNEEDIKEFFTQYGAVIDVVLMYDQERKRTRGFGFLTFEKEESVIAVCTKQYVTFKGKQVECKYAETYKMKGGPPDSQPGDSWGMSRGPLSSGGPGAMGPGAAPPAYPGYQDWRPQAPAPQGYDYQNRAPSYPSGPGYGSPQYATGYGVPGYGGYGQGAQPAGPPAAAGTPLPPQSSGGYAVPPAAGAPAPQSAAGSALQPGPTSPSTSAGQAAQGYGYQNRAPDYGTGYAAPQYGSGYQAMGGYSQDSSSYGPVRSYSGSSSTGTSSSYGAASSYRAPVDYATSRSANPASGYHPYRN